jgi:hypothetical protein
MTPIQFVVLALRLFAVFLYFYVAKTLFTYLAAISSSDYFPVRNLGTVK